MSSSDSEEENLDLTGKLGLSDDSSDGSGVNSDEENYQDEIIYSGDESESEVDEDVEKKGKIEKKKGSEQKELKMPNLELSDDEADKISDLISSSLLPSAKKAKSGTFQSFGLSKKILYNILKKGYKQPTPIQRKSIPFIISGRDVVGMARTGSGKTAAFLLPLIEKLKTHSAKVGARSVILSPNRELALQTFRSFKELSKGTMLRAILLVGGDSLEDQFNSMLQNPDVIIATPGRFLHLRTEMSLDLKTVEYIVFDEADQLFEVAFEEQLNELIASLSPSRQAVLFSATLPKSLVNFAKVGLNNPVLIRLDSESKISDQLEMCFISAKHQEREATLLYILQEVIKMPTSTPEQLAKLSEFTDTRDSDNDSDSDDEEETSKGKKGKKSKKKVIFSKSNELVSPKGTIIFVPTKHHVEYIKNLLAGAGYACSFIYGTLDQHARRRQLYYFKAAVTSILVVTDVAARGIDIPLLKYVINFTLPSSSKLFIHRVGRTARAGNTGFAYSIVTPNEMSSLVEMELFLGRKILLTKMHNAKKALLREKYQAEGKQYIEPVVSYSDRLVLGSAPRASLEEQQEFIKLLLQNYELQTIKEVAEKAEKLYYRSKAKVTSVESLKRAKELLGLGWDDQNLLFGDNQENLKEDFLQKLQNRRKKETVFEFSKNEQMMEFMQKRRRQISSVQKKSEERKKVLEKERMAGLTHTLQDEIFGDKGTEGGVEVGYEVVANEGDLKDTFEDADEIIEKAKETKKIKKDQRRKDKHSMRSEKHTKKPEKKSFKDPQFFLSHYAPVSDIQDKQYDMDSYTSSVQSATFDLEGDDKIQVHKQNSQIMQWSKAKKKYVNSKSTDQKFMIGESGQKIPASYKSGRFESWKNANKISGQSLKPGSTETKGANTSGKRFSHKKDKAPIAPDRFRDDYHKQKKKVDAALERGVGVKGFKKSGSGTNELKSTEDIRKARGLKQKRREKNGRPSKKRKF